MPEISSFRCRVLTFLVLASLLVIPIASHADSSEPFDDRTESPKVINGEPIPFDDPGLFPFLAYVQTPTDEGFGQCTGSLITSNWVLTAAHCFPDGAPADIVGTTPALPPYAAPQWLPAIRTVIHPDYDPTTSRNDIALVELGVDATQYPPLNPETGEALYTPTPILPPSNPPATTINGLGPVYLAGFGLISQDPNTDAEIANWAGPVDSLPSGQCGAFDGSGLIDPNTQLCVSSQQAATCQGDSGGAVFGIENDVLVQYGIVSYGGIPCDSSPTVHTYVPAYFDWITGVLNGDPGGIVANLETPILGIDGIAADATGISNVQGWAYTTTPGAEIKRHVEVFIDGEFAMLVPCCGDRGDVEAAGGPLLAGFSGVYNWGLLESGSHELKVVITSTIGEQMVIVRELNTARFGNHPFVREMEFTNGSGGEYTGGTLSCETVPVSAPENMSSQATVRCFNWLAEARNSSTLCEGNNPDNALYLAFDRSSQSFKTVPVPENSCFR